MPWFEFECESCHKRFDQITRSEKSDFGVCTHCGSKKSKRLLSKFAVGGQGDLRETTMHGCHDCDVPLSDGKSPSPETHEGHGTHDHGHDHSHEE